VLADAGSTDGTCDAAREAVDSSWLVEVECQRGPELDLPYHGHPGRLPGLRAVLRTAHELGVKACAIVDPSLHTLEPAWVERLVGPALSGEFDYVSPYYLRRVTEGALTRSIVYPMFRALYGARLRQPSAGEFGCSARLLEHLVEQDLWEADHARVGIDLWLASAAVCGGFRTCEAALGVRGGARVGTTDLSTTIAQVVGALFVDLEHRVEAWQRVRGSAPLPLVGAVPEMTAEPASLDVDALMESFRLGYRELKEIWTWVLPPRTIVDLRRLTETAADRFRLDDRLWASIVYDFAIGHAFRVMPRDHLLRSLTPLYSGWLASFVIQMERASLAQIEGRVEQVCAGFEAEKRYLISRWRWPEQLRR
jgi:hypothetical protein